MTHTYLGSGWFQGFPSFAVASEQYVYDGNGVYTQRQYREEYLNAVYEVYDFKLGAYLGLFYARDQHGNHGDYDPVKMTCCAYSKTVITFTPVDCPYCFRRIEPRYNCPLGDRIQHPHASVLQGDFSEEQLVAIQRAWCRQYADGAGCSLEDAIERHGNIHPATAIGGLPINDADALKALGLTFDPCTARPWDNIGD